MMPVSTRGAVLGIAVALTVGACTMNKQEAPPLSGPSELSTSISLAANPDVLPQDGFSQSQVVVQVRDGSAQPIRSLPLAAEIVVNGVTQDFGRLSAKNLVTGSDGRATVTYTAPASVDNVDRRTTVSIVVTPVGSNAAAQVGRQVDIRLVPPGIIQPPGPGVPNFLISPTTATQMQPVLFNASDPVLDRVIVAYVPGPGVTLQLNDRVVARTHRHEVIDALLRTWAEDEPIPQRVNRVVSRHPCQQ